MINEHSNLSEAIQNYISATNILAEVMAKIKEKHGRKTLQDITGFDISRINTLCGIGNLPNNVRQDLLPETVAEIIGESSTNARKYANICRADKLKATQLRRLIRSRSKTLITNDKKTKVNDFGKQLLLLENSIKQMDSSTKQRALASLTNSILIV